MESGCKCRRTAAPWLLGCRIRAAEAAVLICLLVTSSQAKATAASAVVPYSNPGCDFPNCLFLSYHLPSPERVIEKLPLLLTRGQVSAHSTYPSLPSLTVQYLSLETLSSDLTTAIATFENTTHAKVNSYVLLLEKWSQSDVQFLRLQEVLSDSDLELVISVRSIRSLEPSDTLRSLTVVLPDLNLAPIELDRVLQYSDEVRLVVMGMEPVSLLHCAPFRRFIADSQMFEDGGALELRRFDLDNQLVTICDPQSGEAAAVVSLRHSGIRTDVLRSRRQASADPESDSDGGGCGPQYGVTLPSSFVALFIILAVLINVVLFSYALARANANGAAAAAEKEEEEEELVKPAKKQDTNTAPPPPSEDQHEDDTLTPLPTSKFNHRNLEVPPPPAPLVKTDSTDFWEIEADGGYNEF